MLLYLIVSLLLIVSANCTTGTLSQYDRRPTDQVLYNRTIPGRTAHTLPDGWQEVDGYIAERDCANIGQIRHVYWRGHSARLMVFDCAGSQAARHWMDRGNILGEIDYYTAQRWGARPQRGLTKAMVCHHDRNAVSQD
jgi:hypothetical protein